MQKKKMAILMTIIVLSVSVFVFFPGSDTSVDYNNNPKHTSNTTENVTEANETIPPVSTIVYNDTILIDQADEQLIKEAVQYKITFHADDIVSYDMHISYHLTNPGTVFYLIYLTNGTSTESIHLSNEAYGNIMDVTTFRKHRSLGKRVDASNETAYTNTITVRNNSFLYLTIAIVSDASNESLTVSFQTQENTMELTRLTRTDKVYLYSALNADYKEGSITERYKGYSLLGLSFSHCYADVQVPITNGGIVCVDMFNHADGMVYIGNSFTEIAHQSYKPNSTSLLEASTDAQLYKYWKVHAEAFGYPKKLSVLSLFVDVYPYSTYHQNDWNGYYQKTGIDSLYELGLKLLKYALDKIIVKQK